MKCEIHGMAAVTSCNWCGNPICEQCLIITGGKKYCPKCYAKLEKSGLPRTITSKKQVEWGEKPDEKVTNKDPNLSEEKIKELRERLKIEEKKKQVWRK